MTNAPLNPLAEGLPRRRFTVADFVRMGEVGLIGEDERLELLDGEIVTMAAKGVRHETYRAAINDRWARVMPRAFRFIPATGLYLSEWTYLEPDFVAFSRSAAIGDLKGPDVLLAVEVADASLGYDLERKPQIYAAHGVRELWVVDVRLGRVHTHVDVGPDGYATVRTLTRAETATPAFAPAELAFALDGLEDL